MTKGGSMPPEGPASSDVGDKKSDIFIHRIIGIATFQSNRHSTLSDQRRADRALRGWGKDNLFTPQR